MRGKFLKNIWLLPLALLMSCAGGAGVSAQRGILAKKLKPLEKPAYRCAERALALVQAHLEFTELELNQGAYLRAAEHIAIVREHFPEVEATGRRPECQDVVETDRDGDGIMDNVDLCPDRAEDFDNYEDEDGCPEDQDTDGDGIADSLDQCPNDPEDFDGVEDEDGCPDMVKDTDADGFPDDKDKCPTDPEDKDGFEDDDGCPEADNDKDGIADAVDQCPMQPEDFDGDADEDGCPDLFKSIIIRKDKIELRQKVHFATGKAKILAKSYDLLNEVGQALVERAMINVRIEGHTDSRGSARYNKKLSQRRADSVRNYLVGRGVGPDRMESAGFGEEQPIDDNRTSDGRAANRRVEFFIIKQ